MDASLFVGNSSYSVGMILSDHKGEFYKAKNLRKEGEVGVFEAETQRVLEALRWIVEIGINDVEIESDSMLSVQALLKGTTSLLEVGNILQNVV